MSSIGAAIADDDPAVQRALAKVGKVLREKWRLDRLIGVGGMAAVFAATHRNGGSGAIKMLHLEFSLDREMRQRFLREGYVANHVAHPGVVRVLDDDVAEDGSAFLVMELLEGETLEALVRKHGGQLGEGDVLSIIDPILSVLCEAHDRGVVHRDIKPENIFVTQQGVIKLLDFGVAKLREPTMKGATRPGSTMGTPAFMPPEQALGYGDEVGPTSDIWALGATMFTLLTGRHVHEAKTSNEQLIASATRHAPSLAAIEPDSHPAIVALVDKALCFDREGRWPDAPSMQRALRQAYPDVVGRPVEDGPRLLSASVTAELAPVSDKAAALVVPALAPTPEERTSVEAMSRTTRISQRASELPPHMKILAVAASASTVGAVLAVLTSSFWNHPAPSSKALSLAPSSEMALPIASASASVSEPASSAAPAASQPRSLAASDLPVASVGAGRVKIWVRGGGCELLVDEVLLGRERPMEVVLPEGEHEISCKLSSGKRLRRTVEAREGEVREVSFHLSSGVADPRDKRR